MSSVAQALSARPRSVLTLVAIASIAALLGSPRARAEDAIDMAELTCRDLNRTYLEQFVVIDAWLSGYFHGRMNKTVLKRQEIAANAAKVVSFCKANPDVTVIKAVEQLIVQN